MISAALCPAWARVTTVCRLSSRTVIFVWNGPIPSAHSLSPRTFATYCTTTSRWRLALCVACLARLSSWLASRAPGETRPSPSRTLMPSAREHRPSVRRCACLRQARESVLGSVSAYICSRQHGWTTVCCMRRAASRRPGCGFRGTRVCCASLFRRMRALPLAGSCCATQRESRLPNRPHFCGSLHWHQSVLSRRQRLDTPVLRSTRLQLAPMSIRVLWSLVRASARLLVPSFPLSACGLRSVRRSLR